MKLIVGLGNPGGKYENTKHNLGFQVLDAFAARHRLSFSSGRGKALVSRGRWTASEASLDFLLLKPQTYMNLSGRSVQNLLSYYKIPHSDLILIYDDLDLELGRIRLKKQGGSGGHRGLASVIQETASEQFVRVKMGIGKDARIDAADYVLSPFYGEAHQVILQSIERAVELLPLLIEERIEEAMNRFNARIAP